MFGCAASFGGGCCSYGSVCGTSECISTVSASTSSKPVVNPAPEGCTTSQISCASNLGGGCCAVTQSCTLVSGSPHCANSIIVPTNSGVLLVEDKAELSVGTKAGLAVGVVVGCGLLIGLATWWCLRRRRERSELSSQQPRPTGVIGAVVGGGRGPTDDASEMVSYRGPLPGVTHDYFGPDAAVGPYTEFHNDSGISTPRAGVPLQPHEPGDIAVPVELDSRTPELMPQGESGARTPIPSPQVGESAAVRYELYGSEFLDPNALVSSPLTPTVPSPPEGPPSLNTGERFWRNQGS